MAGNWFREGDLYKALKDGRHEVTFKNIAYFPIIREIHIIFSGKKLFVYVETTPSSNNLIRSACQRHFKENEYSFWIGPRNVEFYSIADLFKLFSKLDPNLISQNIGAEMMTELQQISDFVENKPELKNVPRKHIISDAPTPFTVHINPDRERSEALIDLLDKPHKKNLSSKLIIKFCNKLLAQGENPNQLGLNGMTPLIHAVTEDFFNESESEILIMMFLRRGANPFLVIGPLMSACEFAINENKTGKLKLFVAAFSKPERSLWKANRVHMYESNNQLMTHFDFLNDIKVFTCISDVKLLSDQVKKKLREFFLTIFVDEDGSEFNSFFASESDDSVKGVEIVFNQNNKGMLSIVGFNFFTILLNYDENLHAVALSLSGYNSEFSRSGLYQLLLTRIPHMVMFCISDNYLAAFCHAMHPGALTWVENDLHFPFHQPDSNLPKLVTRWSAHEYKDNLGYHFDDTVAYVVVKNPLMLKRPIVKKENARYDVTSNYGYKFMFGYDQIPDAKTCNREVPVGTYITNESLSTATIFAARMGINFIDFTYKSSEHLSKLSPRLSNFKADITVLKHYPNARHLFWNNKKLLARVNLRRKNPTQEQTVQCRL